MIKRSLAITLLALTSFTLSAGTAHSKTYSVQCVCNNDQHTGAIGNTESSGSQLSGGDYYGATVS